MNEERTGVDAILRSRFPRRLTRPEDATGAGAIYGCGLFLSPANRTQGKAAGQQSDKNTRLGPSPSAGIF